MRGVFFMRLSLAVGFGGVILLGVFWTPFDPTTLAISDRLQPPSWAHLLGTDHFGRDILSMLMVGAGTSLSVSALAVAIGVGVGVPLGLLASGRKGRWQDEAILRTNDLIFAFPAVLTAIIIAARFGPGAWGAMIAIGVFNIPVFARISRAAALPLWEQDFIRAARLVGKGTVRIAVEHIFPNIAALLLVQATIQFALAILAEAGLAYIGLGAGPPTPSWGRMLADGQSFAITAPHVVIAPGVCILCAVLALNVLADALRRRFHLSGGRG